MLWLVRYLEWRSQKCQKEYAKQAKHKIEEGDVGSRESTCKIDVTKEVSALAN